MSTSPHSSWARGRDGYTLVFAVIVLTALIMRAWNFFALGLDHYDEGVYGLSGFWSLHSYAGPAMYPFQKLFAPPGYFGLIGLAYRLVGSASDGAAIAINVVFGTASAALAGWIGSRWFGRSCGLAAAVFVALSDFNITFDRTALTDTIFSFLFLLTLALIAIALENGSLRSALLAGVTGGVAWNVKYDGWLPAAIAFAAIVALAATHQETVPSVKRKLVLWGIVAGITLLLYLPWVIYTQERLGGYLSVELFHGTFLNFRWFPNFLRQAQNQIYFDGLLSHISPIAAFLIAGAFGEQRALARWRFAALVAGGMLISSLILGGTGTCVALAALGLSATWRRGKILGPMLVTGIAGLFLLIPCYTAFARLVLPWMLLVQIVAGAGVQRLVTMAEAFGTTDEKAAGGMRTSMAAGWAICLTALLAVALVAWRSAVVKTDPWNSTSKDSVRQMVGKMTPMIPSGSVVFVYEEPDAAFYLKRAGYTTFCLMHLFHDDGVPPPFTYATSAPVYLVAGAYARISADWSNVPPEIRSRIMPLAQFPIRPGDVRVLDDFSVSDAIQYRLHPDDRYDLLLLQVNPAQPGGAVLDPP